VCKRKGERERARETERKGWAGGGKEIQRDTEMQREWRERYFIRMCVLVIYTRVQIQMKPKSQFEFVPRDTTKSEFLDLVDFGDASISVQTAICMCRRCMHIQLRMKETACVRGKEVMK